MQEVLLHQKQAIEADLPAYEFVGAARDDGRDRGEFSPLGFRRERFALLASGTFWLSPTPRVPGRGWDAAYPRVASWARLKDKASHHMLLVVNTHFDQCRHDSTDRKREADPPLDRRTIARPARQPC